jgi:hypothetical protein
MRNRIFLIGLFLVACNPSPAPGSKSAVTAYEADGTTVIKFEPCERVGRTYDYPTCGKRLRDSVAQMMCARGKGTHAWRYQIGSTAQLPETTFCR